jgi:hypothetical protein
MAVLAPLDVHRAAVVLLDDQRVLRQFGNIGIGQRVAVALLGRRVHDVLDQLAVRGAAFSSAVANSMRCSLLSPARGG